MIFHDLADEEMTSLHVLKLSVVERVICRIYRGLTIEVEPRRFRLTLRELIVRRAEVYGLLCRL